MTRSISVAALQFAPTTVLERNLEKCESLVRDAAEDGAQIILQPELFCSPYFCQTQDEANFSLAHPLVDHPAIVRFQSVARELSVVLPISIFEKDGPHYFNSVAIIDATGEVLGRYRKSHIPDGPGYQEKFYFRPGNSGFKVWRTKFGKIGVGICWDQWFPEAARAMVLSGAELLLYPSAIGSEPQDPGLDTVMRWQRAMIGHAVSNVIPIVASNRVGDEDGQLFYGSTFIADQAGEIVSKLDRESEGVATATFDLEAIERDRAAWGFFRDRRPDLYGPLV